MTYSAALIGCGRIGYSLGLDKKREQPASHTMALLAQPRVRLVAGCDTDADTLRVWHQANKEAAVYATSAELYAQGVPDIVVIAVNEDAHKAEALAALKARPRLVILEKPVALNMQEARDIEAVANDCGVPVLVNHERRFAADYALAKRAMADIGSVQSIYAGLYSSLCVYDPAKESTGAYSLIHDGTHLVDAVLFFLEQDGNCPQLARPVLTGLWRDEAGTVRQLCAHYAVDSCPSVSLVMSGRSKFFAFEIIITGTHGRICVGNGFLKVYRRRESPLYTGFYSLLGDEELVKPERTGYFANMVQNAVDFLDGTAPLRSTLRTGMNALSVLEDIKALLPQTPGT